MWKGSGISGRERGLEFLMHVDVKGVLKFLVNTSWVEGGMDSGIHWMEHVVCLSDFFVFFVFSLNGTSEQKGL